MKVGHFQEEFKKTSSKKLPFYLGRNLLLTEKKKKAQGKKERKTSKGHCHWKKREGSVPPEREASRFFTRKVTRKISTQTDAKGHVGKGT